MISRLMVPLLLAWMMVTVPSSPIGAATVGPVVVVRTLLLHGNPVPAAVDEPEHHVFVVEAMHRAVYVLDSRDGKLLTRLSLPGQAEPVSVGVDTRQHRVLIAVVAFSPARVAGPPSSVASIVTLDGRTLTTLRTVAISHHPAAGYANVPRAIIVDSRTGRAFALRADGAVIMLDTGTGRVLRYSWAESNPTGGALDASTGRLFVANGGGVMEGPVTLLSMLDATTGRLLRRIALVPSPSSSTVPVPPLGESAALVGLDRSRDQIVLVGTNRGTSQTAVVELDTSTGRILARRALDTSEPSTVADAGAVDEQLGRVYLSTAVDSRSPRHSQIVMLQEDNLGVLRTLNVGGDVGAIGVDVHAHRIFAVDGHSSLVHVFDTWSGVPIRTVRIGSPAAGTNAVHVLIAGATHRAFVGDANGTVTVLNSSLAPVTKAPFVGIARDDRYPPRGDR